MINLLDNAVKYTPEGGSIEVFGKESGNLVTVSVRDTGVGIPMQDIDRIFERFYRVDKARSRMMGGTGLGLTIVQEIVEAHGGRVMVDSDIGHGSTFTVVLPKLQADSEPPGGLRPLW
jgi:signal transduction histidine kinase